MKDKLLAVPITVMLMTAVLFSGCGGKPEAAAPQATPEPVVSTEEMAPVEAPTVDEGLVAYVSGEVDIADESGWFPAQIGDFVTPANRVKTGPGASCEIQFGTTAVIRMQENTEIDISRVSLTPQASKVGIEMVAGTVLSKVHKLAKQDSFSVKTQSAVCGVRGTEFSVTTGKGQDTVFAVKEGSVAVLPPDLDVENLKEQVADKGADTQDALDMLLETAPKVEANQELAVTPEFAAETKELTETVTKAVQEIADAQSSEEVQQKTRAFSSAASESTKTIAAKTAPIAAISPEKAETLKQTDKMKILDIPVAATKESKATQPEIKLYKIGIKVQPADARIMLNGDSTGTGSFSALYESGRTMTFTIEREGYAPYKLPVSVTPESAKLYTIQLAALQQAAPEQKAEEPKEAAPEPTAQTVEPPVQEPEKPEVEAVTETETPSQPEKPAVESVAAAQEPPKPEQQQVAEPAQPQPEKQVQPVPVHITTTPADAQIRIDGTARGTGSVSTDALPGTSLNVSVSRRGFAGQDVTLKVGQDPVSRQIRLEPQPVIFSRKAANEAIIGLAAAQKTIVAASAKGVVTALDENQKQLWQAQTANSPNENSTPVIVGGQVFFSGAKELLTFSLNGGKQINQVALDSNRSHLFGRRVVPYEGKILFPANSALEFFDPANGNFQTFAELGGTGSRMTPGVYKQKILIADQQGTLLVIGPDGTIRTKVSTAAVQPVALAVSVYNDSAVYSGRRGDVVCIDLTNNTVRWERKLSDASVSVATDLAIGRSGVFVYGRDGTVYGLNLADGSDLFTPIRGASTPPIYLASGADIVYGTRDGKLVFASAATGDTQKSLVLGDEPSTRPVIMPGDTLIALGTRQGNVMLIEPAGIE